MGSIGLLLLLLCAGGRRALGDLWSWTASVWTLYSAFGDVWTGRRRQSKIF
jgi:uncharacterized RDD family membrane protein YckC